MSSWKIIFFILHFLFSVIWNFKGLKNRLYLLNLLPWIFYIIIFWFSKGRVTIDVLESELSNTTERKSLQIPINPWLYWSNYPTYPISQKFGRTNVFTFISFASFRNSPADFLSYILSLKFAIFTLAHRHTWFLFIDFIDFCTQISFK